MECSLLKNSSLSGWRFTILLLLAAFLTRLPSLFCGFYNPDETCYATIGLRLLEGKSFYLNIVDHKPPLMYYLYALFGLISKNHLIIVAHAAMILIIWATALSLRSIVKLLDGGDRPALIAAIFYIIAVCCGKPNDVFAANSELIFNLPLTVHFLLLIKAMSLTAPSTEFSLSEVEGLRECERRTTNDERRFFFLLSGLAIGLAGLIKFHALLPLAATFIYILFLWKEKMDHQPEANPPLAERIISCITILTGALSPFALFAIYQHAMGKLQITYYWMFKFNSIYIQGHKSGIEFFSRFIKQTLYMTLLEQSFLWLPIVLWLFVRKSKEPLLTRHELLIKLWFLISVVAIFPGGRFYGHYYLQILPPLCILAGVAVYKLYEHLSHKRMAVIILAILLFAPLLYSWIWALPIDSFHPKLESVENKNLIEYLKKTTSPGEKIEVWGKFNGIPFLVGRENGSRFLNKKFLTGEFEGKDLLKMPDEHWRWFFEDMEKTKPTWFVDHSAIDMSKALISEFPILADYLKKNYVQYGAFEGNIIYKRKNHSS